MDTKLEVLSVTKHKRLLAARPPTQVPQVVTANDGGEKIMTHFPCTLDQTT